jgi:hypothetical protein
MSFPACRHRKKKSSAVLNLVWLGNEPYRLFFLSGILFSMAGVAMWPLFFSGHFPFYPGVSHAACGHRITLRHHRHGHLVESGVA